MNTLRQAMIGFALTGLLLVDTASAKSKEADASAKFAPSTSATELFKSRGALLSVKSPVRLKFDEDRKIARKEISAGRLHCFLEKENDVDVTLSAKKIWTVKNLDRRKALIPDNSMDAEVTHQDKEIRLVCEEDVDPYFSKALLGISTENVLILRDHCSRLKGKFEILDNAPKGSVAAMAYDPETYFAQCQRTDARVNYADIKKAFQSHGLEIEFLPDSPRATGKSLESFPSRPLGAR